MASLASWFVTLRWSLLATLLLNIILCSSPFLFPKYFEKTAERETNLPLINLIVIICLCVFGLLSIGCYFYYLTIAFATSLALYLAYDLVNGFGNIGTYLLMVGVILCSYVYAAVMRRLKNEALYGP